MTGVSLRLVSMNLCLVGRGGNLKYQAPILLSATALSLATSIFWMHRVVGSVLLAVVPALCVTAVASVNVAQAIACLLWLTPWRVKLCEQYKKERLKLWFKQIDGLQPRPDVLCIQEVTNLWYDPSYTNLTLKIGASAGYLYSTTCAARPKFPATLGNSGLIILSRHPILESQDYIFSTQAWFDLFAVGRGFLRARIDVPGTSGISVFNFHFAPNPEAVANLMNVDNSRRQLLSVENSVALRQCDEMAQNAAEWCRPGEPLLLAGDHNFRAESKTYWACRKILESRLASWRPRDVFDGAWLPTFGCVMGDGSPMEDMITRPADQLRPKTIDFVWVPGTSKVVSRDVLMCTVHGDCRFKAVSDHAGLDVSLEL